MYVFCTNGEKGCNSDIWEVLGRFFSNNSEILAKLPSRVVGLEGWREKFEQEDEEVLKEFGQPMFLDEVYNINIVLFYYNYFVVKFFIFIFHFLFFIFHFSFFIFHFLF